MKEVQEAASGSDADNVAPPKKSTSTTSLLTLNTSGLIIHRNQHLGDYGHIPGFLPRNRKIVMPCLMRKKRSLF